MSEIIIREIEENDLEKKLAAYIKKEQNPDGGWPLFWRGESNISTSVKAYYALKIVGEKTTSVFMIKAKKKNIRSRWHRNLYCFHKN